MFHAITYQIECSYQDQDGRSKKFKFLYAGTGLSIDYLKSLAKEFLTAFNKEIVTEIQVVGFKNLDIPVFFSTFEEETIWRLSCNRNT